MRFLSLQAHVVLVGQLEHLDEARGQAAPIDGDGPVAARRRARPPGKIVGDVHRAVFRVLRQLLLSHNAEVALRHDPCVHQPELQTCRAQEAAWRPYRRDVAALLGELPAVVLSVAVRVPVRVLALGAIQCRPRAGRVRLQANALAVDVYVVAADADAEVVVVLGCAAFALHRNVGPRGPPRLRGVFELARGELVVRPLLHDPALRALPPFGLGAAPRLGAIFQLEVHEPACDGEGHLPDAGLEHTPVLPNRRKHALADSDRAAAVDLDGLDATLDLVRDLARALPVQAKLVTCHVALRGVAPSPADIFVRAGEPPLWPVGRPRFERVRLQLFVALGGRGRSDGPKVRQCRWRCHQDRHHADEHHQQVGGVRGRQRRARTALLVAAVAQGVLEAMVACSLHVRRSRRRHCRHESQHLEMRAAGHAHVQPHVPPRVLGRCCLLDVAHERLAPEGRVIGILDHHVAVPRGYGTAYLHDAQHESPLFVAVSVALRYRYLVLHVQVHGLAPARAARLDDRESRAALQQADHEMREHDVVREVVRYRRGLVYRWHGGHAPVA